MSTGTDVLVVDDDEDVRKSFAEILRSTGYAVFEAEDGFVALAYLRSGPLGAMLLDVSMPVLGGLQLLDMLYDPPPVVLIAARPFDEQAMARRSKISSYLQKPVPPSILLKAVAEAVWSSPA